ncbi:uncharacterized protein [Battus philenor]|uniref:uncharacterized protein n=1 Tax=Battus philenor TaxID=42288 RepID=UPI0035D0BE37
MGEITSEKGKPSKKKGRVKKKVVIPRRKPSIVIPERVPVYITADKTTCAECGCFPKEDPYVKNKKLKKCQQSPLTLYELSAAVVDMLPLPRAFTWSEAQVADWIAEEVHLPQYFDCILVNQINGLRLLMLEDPSKLPMVNIHDFQHIKMITSKVRQLFGTEFIRFSRSVGLPPRKPLTHCTWFKSRTGPSWGIRRNWTRCDILRWMKIIMPEPLHLDHWDLVWYHKPDFPKVLFARPYVVPRPRTYIPQYVPHKSKEYLTPRKFRLLTGLTEEQQMIWMEELKPKEIKKKVIITEPEKPRPVQKKLSLTGLSGKELLLARRRMAKPKFLP